MKILISVLITLDIDILIDIKFTCRGKVWWGRIVDLSSPPGQICAMKNLEFKV